MKGQNGGNKIMFVAALGILFCNGVTRLFLGVSGSENIAYWVWVEKLIVVLYEYECHGMGHGKVL